MRLGWVLGLVLVAVVSPARADVITVSYGAAGVQTPSQVVLQNATTIGTETFATRASGTFTTTYGTGGVITGTYRGATIAPADQFGGAGGTGNYVDALANTAGYTISLTTSGVPGVNYFGYWLSALDAGNQIVFKRAGTTVGSYSPSDLMSALGACSGSNPYCGNPTTNFRGQDGTEPFAFVNFVDVSGFFDEIDVYENPSVGNYETDNHTVAYCATPTACVNGTAIPEPISLSLAGAGLVGVALLKYRQRRRS
jgi:hypothetical protein